MESPITMIGRDDEQRQLAAFVTADEGQALVLRGETGVGKSARAPDGKQVAGKVFG
ncbi:ATP-binding protein [Streptomyces sp. 4503]|uniref:ATP-binding protein n=1 Tax=Streptomyces niphimycinicus TaxID=2842201 RepID=A0ABS6CTD7_9ACTN|nr:ATP-binding protein [Streptomyces niphimycinicus]MBU3870177.1 ATP-binding protein [Streptomyces niphimycinicus]